MSFYIERIWNAEIFFLSIGAILMDVVSLRDLIAYLALLLI